MSAPPPPPPPGPPPPPAMGGLKLGSSNAGGDTRSALLQSIQKGTKLKKTVTVDKSGPTISGNICGESSLTQKTNISPKRNISNNTANGNAKLGGIFEGMSAMPKLKPVGGRPGPGANNISISPTKNLNNNSSNQISNGGLDFNAELTKHLTLKKQKQHQQGNVTEANLRTARGPPPQPPIAIQNKNIPLSTSDTILGKNNIATKNTLSAKATSPTLSEGSNSSSSIHIARKNISNLSLSLANNTNVNNSSSTTTSSASSASSQLTPNKSSLFGNTSSHENNNIIKPIVNHGKPNCAPKPPGIHQLVASNIGNNSKPVSRHHSMKSPRSPPIAQPGGPVFPTTQAFATLRNPIQFQSHESINSNVRQAPNLPIGRPTVAPPKPPSAKPPPPPTPVRSASNTNLSNIPLTSTCLSANSTVVSENNNFGSTNNVSLLKEQFSRTQQLNHAGSASNVNATPPSNTLSASPIAVGGSTGKLNSPVNTRDRSITNKNSSAVLAPPLPPHRTCPAPPPPQRQASNNQITAPPVPPQRHSSIRPILNMPSVATAPIVNNDMKINNNSSGGGKGGNVNKRIIDLEMKFGNQFRKVTDFTKPAPYLNIPKIYPSRTHVKASNVTEVRKPRAPDPPGTKSSIQAQ